MTNRQIKESPLTQGEDEILTYSLTTTPWGSDPEDVEITVWDVTDKATPDDWEDVTASVMPVGEPSVVGDVITFPPLENLTDGHIYRIEVQFTCGANTFEPYGLIIGGE